MHAAAASIGLLAPVALLSSRASPCPCTPGAVLPAGAAVLAEGGNAVDAAIAAGLCQGMLNPQASGAGGGHFMLIR